jgi:hypothetical protein
VTLPLLITPGPLLAKLDPGVFPPAETFRTLQLTTLACGRENTAASCDRARALADPLLDHPRLPASCKDTLWEIRQHALVAASNSIERRERIDRAGRDVTVFCRQRATAPPKQENAAPAPGTGGGPGGGGGGFGFGAPPPR